MKKLFLLLTLCFTTLAIAQDNPPKATDPDRPAATADAADPANTNRPIEAANDNNYGWIGLFGLAGLLGLTGRNRVERHDVDRVRTMDRDRTNEPGNIRRAG